MQSQRMCVCKWKRRENSFRKWKCVCVHSISYPFEKRNNEFFNIVHLCSPYSSNVLIF